MPARETINLYASLADMKEVDYKNTLAITALIELLVAKGVLTQGELAACAQRLDRADSIQR